MPWTTRSSSADPAGRWSQFGEATRLTLSSHPVSVSISTRFSHRTGLLAGYFGKHCLQTFHVGYQWILVDHSRPTQDRLAFRPRLLL